MPNGESDLWPESRSLGAYRHEGGFFRLGVGIGRLRDDISLKDERGKASISGGAFAGELYVGGTPWEGVVVGYGSMGAVVYSPDARGPTSDWDPSDNSPLNLSLQGAFLDYYLDVTEGWHGMLLLGYALAYSSSQVIRNDTVPSGPGIAFGAGHEWWIGEEWSLGVMARFIYAVLNLEGETHAMQVPSLQLSVTYH